VEKHSKIIFSDEKTREEYLRLGKGRYEERQLKDWLDKAFSELENNAFCGIQIPKKLIPKEYFQKSDGLGNLWKYNLPEAWRLIYTVKKDQVIILSIVLDWMDHKEYEKRFKY
jgi:Txe/YoeB family toxin of Txe-Axe toxin-antitoxin module